MPTATINNYHFHPNSPGNPAPHRAMYQPGPSRMSEAVAARRRAEEMEERERQVFAEYLAREEKEEKERQEFAAFMAKQEEEEERKKEMFPHFHDDWRKNLLDSGDWKEIRPFVLVNLNCDCPACNCRDGGGCG
ncbi:hypothetical protein V491_01031 [Pseudogymnoascus sp. VKM F-3775]|nr:hypothetical protein V491_01031 [Pseudogymnoascus sp. VKM F-3775]